MTLQKPIQMQNLRLTSEVSTKDGGGGQVALLSECPSCGNYAVSIHFARTVDKCVRFGSSVAPLRLKCRGHKCPAPNLRLHSWQNSAILAEVDASKHRQVSDMKDVAWTLNGNRERLNKDSHYSLKGCKSKECGGQFTRAQFTSMVAVDYSIHHPQCVNKQYLFALKEIKNWTEKEIGNKIAMPIKRWEKRLKGGY